MAPFRLTCRRADRGEVVWQSTDLPDYAQLDLVGPPILGGGTLFIAGQDPPNQQQPERPAAAIRAGDPAARRQAALEDRGRDVPPGAAGSITTACATRRPSRGCSYRAGSVYIDTHVGVLARLDAESGALDWGYGYQTEPVQSSSRFFFYDAAQEPSRPPARRSRSGEALLIKGAKSGRVYAIDPDRMKALWDRPMAKVARLLGVDDRALFLGGAEIGALDLQSRVAPLGDATARRQHGGRVLVRPDGLWQLTSRGIFEIDPKSGESGGSSAATTWAPPAATWC